MERSRYEGATVVTCVVWTGAYNDMKLSPVLQFLMASTLPFDEYFNYPNTSYLYDKTSVPCKPTVPGFNALGLVLTYMLVFVFSTVGNSLVICVVCCMVKRRTSTDIYLTHLALAELFFGLTLPFWAIEVHYGWIFGNVMCKVLSGFQEVLEYSSLFMLMCISVDRYLAIVKATQVRPPSRLVVTLTCATVWLVAVVLSIPTVVQKRHMNTQDLDICYEDLTEESSDRLYIVMHIMHYVLGFFLPLGVMAVCYGSTLVTLCRAHNRHKQKAIRVILAVVFTFIVCWLPYNVVLLIQLVISSNLVKVVPCETRYRVEVAFNVTRVFAFVHCAINPVLYTFIGVKFRNHLLTECHKRGLISSTLLATYKRNSVSSAGSARSRNTSVTL